VLELDCGLPFDLTHSDDFFSALPARPAVCLIELRDESAEPLLIRTQDLRRRLERLLEAANADEQLKGVVARLGRERQPAAGDERPQVSDPFVRRMG